MNPDLTTPKVITPELAEEIGWHIGDGSMNFYANKCKKKGLFQLRGHKLNDREHYLKIIKPTFKKLYNLSINLRDMESTGVFGFQLWNSELVKFKQSLGLPLGKKSNITIPKAFIKNKQLIIPVLRGLFDTDGGIYLEPKNGSLYPRVYLRTISHPLAEQVFNLLESLELRPTIYTEGINKKQRRPNESHVVSLNGKAQLRKFMKIICLRNPHHVKKYEFYEKLFKEPSSA